MEPLTIAAILGGGYLLYKKMNKGTAGPRRRVSGRDGKYFWDVEQFVPTVGTGGKPPLLKTPDGKNVLYFHVYYVVPSTNPADSPLIVTYYTVAGPGHNKYSLGSPKLALDKFASLVTLAIRDFELKKKPASTPKAAGWT